MKIALAQLLGAGGPDIIQGITEEQLNLKIQLCQELLKLFNVIASGSLINVFYCFVIPFFN